VVFGAAIGSRITEVEGVSYGTFIVPGLVMLSVLTQSIANASFGIYFPKFVGTIYEILSAPISYYEIVIGYVGAAATKSIVLGLIILATAALFVPLHILHPWWMLTFLVLTAVTFSLFGFIIGIWADGFEKLQIVPLMIVTPLAFLTARQSLRNPGAHNSCAALVWRPPTGRDRGTAGRLRSAGKSPGNGWWLLRPNTRVPEAARVHAPTVPRRGCVRNAEARGRAG
jgi:hypothetical protein